VASVAAPVTRAAVRRRPQASRGVRLVLITTAGGFLGLFLLAPLVALVQQALAQGVRAYVAALANPDIWTALRLSLTVTAMAVPLNTAFGIAAAWAITKHDFRGKSLLVTLIDLPFSVSPVIAGLVLVLLFGRQGVLGPWLESAGLRVIFALPGVVLATLFVTFPLVARELIPLMEAQGREEELAAHVLGASGWRTLWRVTLPNIKWGVLYGVILCAARSMGEFGAVSVVSGHIRGLTTTLPLQVEILYNEYNSQGAFAAASLLALFALVSLGLKTWVERRGHAGRGQEPAGTGEHGDPG
jgi:sulfate transport system permease protein